MTAIQKCAFLVNFFIILTPLAVFAGNQLDQAKAAYTQKFPDRVLDPRDVSFGDLNGDGIPDFVAFYGDASYNQRGIEDLGIVVFLGGKSGSFSFYKASSTISGNERVGHSVKIKNGSLFFSKDGSGGCCSHWAEDYQFKMRDGDLRLIGATTMTFATDGTSDDYGSSRNLLTGAMVKWTRQGKLRTEVTSITPKQPLVLFSAFDDDAYSEAMNL
ncbi:hypothetical protein HX882_07930 [Pseudomonas gingeri]|uniref:VCBS repeat-containing protein n=1 Tax=Pseudomonas gingeri TaxID=117681 RepID=A0A7Y7X9R6_9PSED|nr:hypothetical protein [Pseudomonas gingeri]NWB95812.1 hypothetical protein [Pseudomonas gingeri]